jgi:hypothetical protein
MTHLPLIMARQDCAETTFSAKWLPHTHAGGGQVAPVLGGV